jgi:hypothetical protein
MSILNVRFTGNLERHERALRAIWGGALCVTMAERTAAELETIQDALQDELSPIVASAILPTGRIHLHVVVDDDGLQQRLDDRYGPGLVGSPRFSCRRIEYMEPGGSTRRPSRHE